MDLFTINYIKTHPLIYNYLRENSTHYKTLMRDGPQAIKSIEEEAKKFYKQTPLDKIQKLSENINLISSLIDVIK